MKSSVLSMLAVMALTTINLSGCNGQDDSQQAKSVSSSSKPISDNQLTNFLSLHKQYCEQGFNSREALVSALEADTRFQPAVGFNGVYETRIKGVSFAISPEVDGCTTDVLVQSKQTGEVLFSYEQMNNALMKRGYKVLGDETSRKDLGADQLEVTILEKTFVSPAGETTNLDYPADRLDQYYMTLFAKKFNPPSVEEAVSLNN